MTMKRVQVSVCVVVLCLQKKTDRFAERRNVAEHTDIPEDSAYTYLLSLFTNLHRSNHFLYHHQHSANNLQEVQKCCLKAITTKINSLCGLT